MKIEVIQAIQDRLAENAAGLTPAERYELWPESQYGGDGPWNNYGEDDNEKAFPVLCAQSIDQSEESPF